MIKCLVIDPCVSSLYFLWSEAGFEINTLDYHDNKNNQLSSFSWNVEGIFHDSLDSFPIWKENLGT